MYIKWGEIMALRRSVCCRVKVSTIVWVTCILISFSDRGLFLNCFTYLSFTKYTMWNTAWNFLSQKWCNHAAGITIAIMSICEWPFLHFFLSVLEKINSHSMNWIFWWKVLKFKYVTRNNAHTLLNLWFSALLPKVTIPYIFRRTLQIMKQMSHLFRTWSWIWMDCWHCSRVLLLQATMTHWLAS